MDFNNSEQKIKLSKMVWIFLLAELIILFLVVYFILKPQETALENPKTGHTLLYLSYITAIVAIPISFYIKNIMSKKALKEKSLVRKTQLYFNSVIAGLSILELAGVFSIIAFYFSKQTQTAYMFGIIIVAILLSKPSQNAFDKEFLGNEQNDIDENTIF